MLARHVRTAHLVYPARERPRYQEPVCPIADTAVRAFPSPARLHPRLDRGARARNTAHAPRPRSPAFLRHGHAIALSAAIAPSPNFAAPVPSAASSEPHVRARAPPRRISAPAPASPITPLTSCLEAQANLRTLAAASTPCATPNRARLRVRVRCQTRRRAAARFYGAHWVDGSGACRRGSDRRARGAGRRVDPRPDSSSTATGRLALLRSVRVLRPHLASDPSPLYADTSSPRRIPARVVPDRAKSCHRPQTPNHAKHRARLGRRARGP
ncbi:hypothetical protein B0H17DRAFT_1076399 [Mycena rosella]|uniref:Uncharacterized protein n=1 Tax=Mycena rosella TaxID=1033263 RepID=A0AAD7D6B6_MYCRO|nr:hypothetical protein B0H17DRAFT_1076399 [Mycena rosella]